MAVSEGSFPLFSLPAEIRMMVYSYVILPSFDIDVAEQTAISNAEKARISSERQIWHKTARSLLLTCKWVGHEATSLFYRNKTVLLSRPTLERIKFPPLNSPIRSSRRAVLRNITRIEFNLRLDQIEDTEAHDELLSQLTRTDQLLRADVRRFPNLQTISYRLVDVFKPFLITRHTQLPLDFDLNVEFALLRRSLAAMKPEDEEWEYFRPYRESDVLDFLLDATDLHRYGNAVENEILPRKQWACTKSLYKATVGKSELDIFVHELKYEKRSCDDEYLEELENEEDTEVGFKQLVDVE